MVDCPYIKFLPIIVLAAKKSSASLATLAPARSAGEVVSKIFSILTGNLRKAFPSKFLPIIDATQLIDNRLK